MIINGNKIVYELFLTYIFIRINNCLMKVQPRVYKNILCI